MAEDAPVSGCPEWAKEELPREMLPFVGRFGLPDPYPQRRDPLGKSVAGIDRWQANQFIAYRAETARFLYGAYTPTKVDCRRGTLPAYEKLVARYTAGMKTDREKATALLTQALPREFRHPTMPPLGAPVRADRALLDEALLKSGAGFCNEQARVFTRLCQAAGIPARIIQLFYSDKRTGHTISEFYADGRWAMADSSWFCVFPAADGPLMSAAECHEEGPNRRLVGETYFGRFQQLIAMPDEELVGGHFAASDPPGGRKEKVAAEAAAVRKGLRARTAQALGDQLWRFGIINYPLPH